MAVGKRRAAELPGWGPPGTLHLNPGAEATQQGWGSAAVCRDRPSGEAYGRGWGCVMGLEGGEGSRGSR